jgi:hypothetical protein
VTTTGLIDPAAKAALGLGPREWVKVVRIEVAPAGNQAVKLSVSVDPGPNSLKQAEPAGALLRELVNRAKAVVSQSVETRREEIKTRLDELEKRRAVLHADIEGIRKRVHDADESGFRGRDSVANQRRQIESELATKRPRLQAIKEVVPQSDEVEKSLRQLVAAREALVAGLEKVVGQTRGDPTEIFRARAELAEAKVRLAEWGNVSSFSPSHNVRAERVNLEIDIAALESQLKTLPAEPLKQVEDVQHVRSEQFRADSERSSLEAQYQQVRREHELLVSPPTLVVLDGQRS